MRDFQWCQEKELNFKGRYLEELFFNPASLEFQLKWHIKVTEPGQLINAYEPLVILSDSDVTYEILNLETEKVISIPHPFPFEIEFARIQNGILILGWHNWVVLLDSMTGNLLHNLKGHGHEITYYQVQGNLLATGSRDAIKVWDIQEGTCLMTTNFYTKDVYIPLDDGETFELQKDPTGITSMLLQDGEVILGRSNGDVTFINIKSGLCTKTSTVDADSKLVGYVGNRLITNSETGCVKAWNLREEIPFKRCYLALKGGNSLLALRGNMLFIGNKESGDIKVWNIQNGRHYETISSECQPLRQFYAYGNKLIVAL